MSGDDTRMCNASTVRADISASGHLLSTTHTRYSTVGEHERWVNMRGKGT